MAVAGKDVTGKKPVAFVILALRSPFHHCENVCRKNVLAEQCVQHLMIAVGLMRSDTLRDRRRDESESDEQRAGHRSANDLL